MVLTLVALWRRLGERAVARRGQHRLAGEEAARDARDLIRRHGDGVYYLARQLARAAAERRRRRHFPSGHWDRVRRRIAEMTGREITAEGVRYSCPRTVPKGEGRSG